MHKNIGAIIKNMPITLQVFKTFKGVTVKNSLNDAYKKIYGQFNNCPIVQSTFFFYDDINEVVDDVCTNEMVVKLV